MSSTLVLGPESRLVLVDASSFVFRAYHQSLNQDPKYNVRPSDGLPTGAVRLFFAKLFQFVRDGAAGVVPTHLGIVFEIVNRFKGRSSRPMRQEFPALRSRLPTLWSRSYYAGSVGHVGAKVIEAYIAAQKGI